MRKCGTCGVDAVVRQFPALFRKEASRLSPGPADLAGEGSQCFSHPDVVAVQVCGGCGRFMCRDCDTEWDGEHLCLSCIHDRREVKQETGFVSRRLIYDNAALGILAIPIVFFYPLFFLGFLTGPLAMYYLIRYRGSSRGFVPRGRFRTVLAWIVSVVTILLCLASIGFFLYVIFELSVTGS